MFQYVGDSCTKMAISIGSYATCIVHSAAITFWPCLLPLVVISPTVVAKYRCALSIISGILDSYAFVR